MNLTRRDFLKTGGSVLALAALFPNLLNAAPAAKRDIKKAIMFGTIASVIGTVVPGTLSTSARAAASRDEILSPITSIASGGGPIHVTPAAVIVRAKSAFSEKKP